MEKTRKIDYYEELEVSHDATHDEIREAYKKLALVLLKLSNWRNPHKKYRSGTLIKTEIQLNLPKNSNELAKLTRCSVTRKNEKNTTNLAI